VVQTEVFGAKHIDVAISYNGIANVYTAVGGCGDLPIPFVPSEPCTSG